MNNYHIYNTYNEVSFPVNATVVNYTNFEIYSYTHLQLIFELDLINDGEYQEVTFIDEKMVNVIGSKISGYVNLCLFNYTSEWNDTCNFLSQSNELNEKFYT